jgi:PAS domain S-box-containing protein
MESLSLRLGVFSVISLTLAAVLVGYLFDRGRTHALEAREREHLRLHAERAADEIQRHITRLQSDVLFLGQTPPVQGIRRAREAHGFDAQGGSTLKQWRMRLAQIFHAFAAARPGYFQLRLIGVDDGGRELVRVERRADGFHTTPLMDLQQKGDRYYFHEALNLPKGGLYLSPIDLNQEHGANSRPIVRTLRAATVVQGPQGTPFGILVVNMDMGHVLGKAQEYLDFGELPYVIDDTGRFLLHPDAGRTIAAESGQPYLVEQEFPGAATALGATSWGTGTGSFFKPVESRGESVSYLAPRIIEGARRPLRFAVIVSESRSEFQRTIGLARRDSLLSTGLLLGASSLLAILVVRGQTASLRRLAVAARSIAGGRYEVELPGRDGGEVGLLSSAFRRMVEEVRQREQAMDQLNRDLEQRVLERTVSLHRQQALQEQILDSVDDGVVVADREGRFVLWNQAAARLLGSGPEAVEPQDWSRHFGLYRSEQLDLIPPAELPLVRAMRGEESSHVELFVFHPGGSQGRWVSVTSRPLRAGSNGALAGGVATLVDISAQKRMGEMLQDHQAELARVGRLALLGGIAGSLTHDLSQPLAAVANYAGAAIHLLRTDGLDAQRMGEILTHIVRLADRAGKILESIRELNRQRPPQRGRLQVVELVDTCLQLVGPLYRRHRISLERQFGDDLPSVYGDRIELEQVIMHLLVNSLDALRNRSALPGHVRVVAESPDPSRVVVRVLDNGPGLSPDIEKHAFEPWVSDKPGYIGIGLSMSRTIVENHQGRIWLRRVEDRETEAAIELPAHAEPQP